MSEQSSSSGKSKEEVAFDILSKLKGVGIWGENNKDAILDMYSECLEATSGKRGVFTKQKPVAATPRQQTAPAASPTAPRPQSAAEIAAAANLEAFNLTSAAPQGGQPVHEQQAQLKQAFKPGA